MASADEHRTQSSENFAFYEQIRASHPDRRDWAITVLFYAMVHEIQALFADNRGTVIGYGIAFPVRGHRETKVALRMHRPWSRLATYYAAFEGWSRKTRYECFMPTNEQVAKMEDLLKTVRKEIAGLK